jgi:CMP-N,N'-diacetyllegionaminic acid synthase
MSAGHLWRNGPREMNKPKILALIPARSGSKGLPGKNLRMLHGKPLLAYSILAACASSLVDRVIVSTDDPGIAEVAREYGAEVPFLRPADLASDTASVDVALDFTLQTLKADYAYSPDYASVFYPTSPFRTRQLVDSLLHKLLQGYTSVKTVKKIDPLEGRFYYRNQGSVTCPLESRMGQLVAGSYLRCYGLLGAWKLSAEAVERGYLHLIANPVELVDIDSLADFELAERILADGLYDPEAER